MDIAIEGFIFFASTKVMILLTCKHDFYHFVSKLSRTYNEVSFFLDKVGSDDIFFYTGRYEVGAKSF